MYLGFMRLRYYVTEPSSGTSHSHRITFASAAWCRALLLYTK